MILTSRTRNFLLKKEVRYYYQIAQINRVRRAKKKKIKDTENCMPFMIHYLAQRVNEFVGAN